MLDSSENQIVSELIASSWRRVVGSVHEFCAVAQQFNPPDVPMLFLLHRQQNFGNLDRGCELCSRLI
jgi:hypothetical protein